MIVTETEALLLFPCVSVATPPMLCVPLLIFFFCQVVAQDETLKHVERGAPSAVIVMDAMPIVELAETAILTLPFGLAPFVGELIATLGAEAEVAASVETDTLDDWAELLPAAS
jgi:hypothetical protein